MSFDRLFRRLGTFSRFSPPISERMRSRQSSRFYTFHVLSLQQFETFDGLTEHLDAASCRQDQRLSFRSS